MRSAERGERGAREHRRRRGLSERERERGDGIVDEHSRENGAGEDHRLDVSMAKGVALMRAWVRLV